MKQEDILQNKYGKNPGFKVPENYFDNLQKQIIASLPEYKESPKAIDTSRWQRFKPYLYLAAMFCGIWLMMKVFHSVSQPIYTSLDNPPEALVQLIDEDRDSDWKMISYEIPDYDIEEEVSLDYDSMEEFQKDFGYSLKPEYSSISLTSEAGTKV